MSRIIVTDKTFDEYLMHIRMHSFAAVDVETTGLNAYNGDRLFCITVSTSDHDFYFDFHEGQENFDENGEETLLDRSIIPNLFDGFTGTLFAHSAKFDMHFLANEGLDLTVHDIHCTEAVARLENNAAYNLQLATCVRFIGLKKGKEVEDYIKKYKLHRIVRGKKEPCYNQVPFEIMMPYASLDTNITLRLGLHQLKSLKKQQMAIEIKCPTLQKERNLLSLLKIEKKLTKALFRMERKGVRIDPVYTKLAYNYEVSEYQRIAALFKDWCGLDFKDDKSTLVQAFIAAGETIPRTDKGNYCLNKEALEKMDSPLAIMVKDYRRSYQMAHTYYENILFFADKNGIIHPNFQQGGAKSGRLSCRQPNMQNMPSKGEDTAKFPVRKCFIPLEGYLWISIDWKAMEYRLMLDYAGEMTLIEKIKVGHLDVHQATGDLINMVRAIAKNVNFALLYGTGNAHLGTMIKRTTMEAKKIRAKYFSKLPKVKRFIEMVKRAVKLRGYVITHYGRKLKVDRDKDYVGPNYLIQGGCADMMKKSLVEVDEFLLPKKCKSHLTLTVHDEADLQIHLSELELIEPIAEIMTNIYDHNHLPMAVDVEYTKTNWAELKEFKYDDFII